MPIISLCLPARNLDPFNLCDKCLYNISFISDDFPEPETPVIHTKVPNGIFTSIFLRLFSFAPNILILLPFPLLL